MSRLAYVLIVIHYLLDGYAAKPELKTLNIIFRHGDRTPTTKSLYLNDPYYKSNFYPYGHGALTNTGKLRAYKLGEFLHGRYKNFLGDVYLPELLYARSTDYDRTKMSLQLVLAALFPPTNVQKWHDILNWQPIPITYVPKPDDDLLAAVHLPKFEMERQRVKMKKDIQERLGNLRGFMSELSNLTGNNIDNSLNMRSIYDTLTAESFMNLTLPEWTKNVFPNGKLLEGLHLDYDISSYDKNITKVLTGKLMTKITLDMLAAKNIMEKRRTKLFLYSGHEINLIGVMNALNVYKTHEPRYSSAMIIELLEDKDEHYIKVLYYQGIPSILIELELPGCSVLCPLEKYLMNVNETLELDDIDR